MGRFGTQSRGCAGQTVRPSLHSISQTSVGKLSIFDVLSLRVGFDFLVLEGSGEAQRYKLAPFQPIESHSMPASLPLHDIELAGTSQRVK